MKKQSLLFGLAVLSSVMSSKAQITITSADIKTAGNFVVQATDDLPDASINAGGSGSGQSWDFSSLSDANIDTVMFLSPTGLPHASSFPTATVAITNVIADNNSSWAFLSNTSTELRLLGTVSVDMFDTIDFPFNKRIITFPSAFNTSFSETNDLFVETEEFGIDPDMGGPHPFVDSVRIKLSVTSQSTMDAEGTMTLPTGDFTALRQRINEIQIDSLFMLAGGNWSLISPVMEAFLGTDAVSKDSTLNYFWWAKGVGFPLVQFEADFATGDPIETVDWAVANPATVGIAEDENVESALYPNPSNGVVNINLQGGANNRYTLNLYNLSGQQVETYNLSAAQSQVNLEGLTSGLYFYQLISADQKIAASGKLNVQK